MTIKLTQNETDVLSLIYLRDTEISKLTGLSEHTVSHCNDRLKKKFRVRSRAALSIAAYMWGFTLNLKYLQKAPSDFTEPEFTEP